MEGKDNLSFQDKCRTVLIEMNEKKIDHLKSSVLAMRSCICRAKNQIPEEILNVIYKEKIVLPHETITPLYLEKRLREEIQVKKEELNKLFEEKKKKIRIIITSKDCFIPHGETDLKMSLLARLIDQYLKTKAALVIQQIYKALFSTLHKDIINFAHYVNTMDDSFEGRDKILLHVILGNDPLTIKIDNFTKIEAENKTLVNGYISDLNSCKQFVAGLEPFILKQLSIESKQIKKGFGKSEYSNCMDIAVGEFKKYEELIRHLQRDIETVQHFRIIQELQYQKTLQASLLERKEDLEKIKEEMTLNKPKVAENFAKLKARLEACFDETEKSIQSHKEMIEQMKAEHKKQVEKKEEIDDLVFTFKHKCNLILGLMQPQAVNNSITCSSLVSKLRTATDQMLKDAKKSTKLGKKLLRQSSDIIEGDGSEEDEWIFTNSRNILKSIAGKVTMHK